jgi:biopolymer transport protein ExbB
MFADLGTAGPVLALLAVLSVVSVAVFLARVLALRRVTAGQEAREAWLEAIEQGSVAPFAGNTATYADRVAARASALMALNADPEHMSSDLMQMGNRAVLDMGRGIRLLELIGMIAPLLGLLGTVLGMIQSFHALELAQGAANASILAGGIWQALLTTAAGLVVAIPAVVGAAILQARSEAGTQAMEQVIGRATLAQRLNRKDKA